MEPVKLSRSLIWAPVCPVRTKHGPTALEQGRHSVPYPLLMHKRDEQSDFACAGNLLSLLSPREKRVPSTSLQSSQRGQIQAGEDQEINSVGSRRRRASRGERIKSGRDPHNLCFPWYSPMSSLSQREPRPCSTASCSLKASVWLYTGPALALAGAWLRRELVSLGRTSLENLCLRKSPHV